MPRQIASVDAARKDRSLVPSSHRENKLKAEPVLLVWRRLIDLAADEAKKTRFGEPTDTAILARWWIAVDEIDDGTLGEFRATFPRACGFLGIDPMVERVKLLREVDASLLKSLVTYSSKRLDLRRRAVLTTAGCPNEMSKTYALLLISEMEYEDTAGINRADPPSRVGKLRTPKAARLAPAFAQPTFDLAAAAHA